MIRTLISQQLSGTESRIASCTIPRMAGLEWPAIPQQEAKKRVESQKIDSELPSESHPNNA